MSLTESRCEITREEKQWSKVSGLIAKEGGHDKLATQAAQQESSEPMLHLRGALPRAEMREGDLDGRRQLLH